MATERTLADQLGLTAMKPIGWVWTDINGDRQVNWHCQPTCEHEPLYGRAAISRVLAHSREVYELSEHLHASNNALRLDVLDMREVMRRMVTGIDHLAEVARRWEPDHSTGAERRGWLLAQDAKDDAERLLAAQAERLLSATLKASSATPAQAGKGERC